MAKSSKKEQKAPLEPTIEYVLAFDGQDDWVELPPTSMPTGNEITCSFWAYGGETLPSCHSVIRAINAKDERLLNIHLPWDNSNVYFDCRNSSGYDRIYKEAQPTDYKGKWSHWAFTKNGTTGEMKIYLNGELWHQGSGEKNFSIPQTVKARLGCSFISGHSRYQGKLAEVQLWSRDRTQAEIQQDMHRRLSGNEPGLVSYWSLNEGSGTIAHDKTSAANHGTIQGSANWVVSDLAIAPLESSPKKGSSTSTATPPTPLPVLSFDGQDDCVDLGAKPQFKVQKNITLELWVYIESQRQYSGIISKVFDTGSTESGYGLLLDGISGIYFGVKVPSQGIQYLSSGANTVPLKEWHHIAGTYDGQQLRVYVDGVEKAVQSLGDSSIHHDPDSNLRLGMYQDNDETYAFQGKIAEVRLWGVTRTQAEIQQDMNYRLTGTEPGLVGYWPLNEGTSTTIQDKTANGNQGTIVGATWQQAQLPLEELTQRIAPPIPPVRLQGRLMVLVLDENHQGISAGSGALRPQGRFAIEAWVYPAIDAGKQVIFAEGGTLLYLEGGELKFQTPLSTKAIASSGAGIASGSWYHVAVARAGGGLGDTKLYINGVRNDNQTAISPVLSFGNTYLGLQPDAPDSRFQGKLLEVRVWRYARSQAEIEANRLYPLTGRELGLVRCWSLNDTLGSILEDKTTNRAVGVVSQDAVWEEVEIPLKLKLDPQERLTRSTGLEDYGYWYKEMAKQQKTEADPPFRRGRIWA